MKEMKRGYIQSFNPERRCGTIVSDRDRFWYHADRIVKGLPNPEIGSVVLFEISPKPTLPNKLPVAIQIVILDDEMCAGQRALAEKDDTQGSL
jgi:hypothetical protein